MNSDKYWLSKRRIETRVPYEHGCSTCANCSFGLLRCPACGEIYLAEWEHERLYSRRDLSRAPQRLGTLWKKGCLKCGDIDTADGCSHWCMTLPEVRASWWKWALLARLRRNRRKRALLRSKLESIAVREKSNSPSCNACYFGLFPSREAFLFE